MVRIFLSASVPLPDRHPKYLATADIIAIRESIKALVSTVLHEGHIIFGGHPAITPLVALLLKGMPAALRKRAIMYQSDFFQAEFIKENNEFIKLHRTPAVGNNRDASLAAMRKAMIQDENLDAAVFIGGMEGIWEEFEIFRNSHRKAPCFPIASTGAAALELYGKIGDGRRYLLDELTYPTLFRKILDEVSRMKG